MSWCLIHGAISFQNMAPISANLSLEVALTSKCSVSSISISVLSCLPSVFLLDVDVRKLLFDLFSCYLICFVLILENTGLAELQGEGEEEKEKREKNASFSLREIFSYLSQKNHSNKWFKYPLDLLSKVDWKVWGFCSIKQTALPCKRAPYNPDMPFPMPGWRLQAAFKEPARMQKDAKHEWFFCLA